MPTTARLPIFIEERGGRTLQEQIYLSIRQSIVDGLVEAGRRLPSTRVLAADLGVSRTTALIALEQLRAEGYVVARPGSGGSRATISGGRSSSGSLCSKSN